MSDEYKKQNFNRIWNKESSKSRDTLKQKVIMRGLRPTEKNCFEYYMGYIRSFLDRSGETIHVNPYYNKTVMRHIGLDKYGRPLKHKSKKKKRNVNNK
jgi:hypothetical protein